MSKENLIIYGSCPRIGAVFGCDEGVVSVILVVG